MSKRKLTKQQHRRISAQQEKIIELNDPNIRKGLIISRFAKTTLIECEQSGKIFPCDIRQNLGTLVCGDQVQWQLVTQEQGVIVAVLPRSSLLSRINKAGTVKPLAANVNQVIITLAVKPALSTYLLDSYLVACEALGLNALILLNKCDLLENESELDATLEPYIDMGYDCIKLSAKDPGSLKPLKQHLIDHASVFVGQSGVGKSTLINQVIPSAEIETRAISEQTELGTHSTTTSRLYHLEQGGDLIDSPGVREFGLSHMSQDKILECFIDFKPYLGTCKFRNCSHDNEPHCALLEAVKAGTIAKHRLAHYHKIMQQYGQD